MEKRNRKYEAKAIQEIQQFFNNTKKAIATLSQIAMMIILASHQNIATLSLMSTTKVTIVTTMILRIQTVKHRILKMKKRAYAKIDFDSKLNRFV